MKKQMTLKIRVDNGLDRANLTSLLAANGYWVTKTVERNDKRSYGSHDYFVLVKGEFEVVAE